MSYQLKLLSGTLNGVEYALVPGDTIFHIGSQRELLEGHAAQVLGGVDNAFYLPEDLPEAAFVVQVMEGQEGLAPLRLGERDGADQPWLFRPIHPQAVVCAAGIYFSVRATGEAWAQEVLDFTPPAPLATVVAADSPIPSAPMRLRKAHRRRYAALWVGLIGLALIAVVSAWFYWQYTPEVRVKGLATVLRDAPGDYQILAGSDGKLYAFTDDRNGQAWGERASRRLQRRDDVYLLRWVEVQRLEQALVQAELPLVVVRLEAPAQPHVVLLGPVTAVQRERVQALMAAQAPYATHPAQVSSTSDAALVSLAQAQLRGLGISSRAEPLGQRVSVINDVFLDDASLNAMAGMARGFHHEWGQRRITVHPQLWDDLLQGRSYRYSPGQLMSVGEGRWNYARASDGSAPAAP